MQTVLGTVHGDTIKLQHPLSMSDGQQVEIDVRPLPQSSNRAWGEGIRASAGALADMPELDRIMDEIYQQRKIERRNQVE